LIYILLFILSFALTYIIKQYAIKKSLVAIVNERSSHTVPTPHGGGIAITIIWFIGIIYLYLSNQIDMNIFYAFLAGSIISVVSFFDDLYELSPKLRIVVQSIVALIGLYFIDGFHSLGFGVFEITNTFVTNLFAFLLILWFINLTNFIDGINGYVGSMFVFLGVAGFTLFDDSYFLILIVAVLGFLYWNWNKAKIFMGDVGSTLLGYNIAIITLSFGNQSSDNFWIWILLFSLFWFDATITLIRRKMNGENLSQAHKKHAYQRLTQAGWSHYKVTNYSIVLNCILFCFVYFVSNVIISLLLAMLLLTLVMLYVEKKKQFK
jgi:Fuc2NAc and GlcNAc transferase